MSVNIVAANDTLRSSSRPARQIDPCALMALAV